MQDSGSSDALPASRTYFARRGTAKYVRYETNSVIDGVMATGHSPAFAAVSITLATASG